MFVIFSSPRYLKEVVLLRDLNRVWPLVFNLCIKFHFRFFESTIEFLFNRLLQILVCLQFPDSNGESIANFLTIAFFIERLSWLLLSRSVFRTPSNIYGAFLQKSKQFFAFNLEINICQICQLTYFTNEVFSKLLNYGIQSNLSIANTYCSWKKWLLWGRVHSTEFWAFLKKNHNIHKSHCILS